MSSIAALSTAIGSGYYAATKCALEGLLEGLCGELAPLGIKVMVVEPGAFLTKFAGRSLTQSSIIIDDYAETEGTRRIGKGSSHGSQIGNSDKGAKLIIEAIESEKTPFRLLLGTDAIEFADKVLKKRKKENEEWRLFSRQSDY